MIATRVQAHSEANRTSRGGAAMIPLFILLTVRNLAHGVIPAHAAVVRFSAGWAG